jgi:hypothetical protein
MHVCFVCLFVCLIERVRERRGEKEKEIKRFWEREIEFLSTTS